MKKNQIMAEPAASLDSNSSEFKAWLKKIKAAIKDAAKGPVFLGGKNNVSWQ